MYAAIPIVAPGIFNIEAIDADRFDRLVELAGYFTGSQMEQIEKWVFDEYSFFKCDRESRLKRVGLLTGSSLDFSPVSRVM